MKTLQISYWNHKKFNDLPWEHNQTMFYTKRKRNKILDKCLDKGYYVMLKEYTDLIVIYIDDKRFNQR